MAVSQTEPGDWKRSAWRRSLLRRAFGKGARRNADGWDDDQPCEGDHRADQRSMLDELVGDRVQADQENEHDEEQRDPRPEPATAKTLREQPPSSNHGATVAPQAIVVHRRPTAEDQPGERTPRSPTIGHNDREGAGSPLPRSPPREGASPSRGTGSLPRARDLLSRGDPHQPAVRDASGCRTLASSHS